MPLGFLCYARDVLVAMLNRNRNQIWTAVLPELTAEFAVWSDPYVYVPLKATVGAV